MVGWLLVWLGVFVAGVWIASGWWSLTIRGGRWRGLDIGAGRATWTNQYGEDMADEERAGVWWTHFDGEPCWYLRELWYEDAGCGGQTGAWESYGVAFWPVPIVMWLPAAGVLCAGVRARTREAKGLCGACGYDLVGLVDAAACPECGRGATALRSGDRVVGVDR